MIPRFFSIQVVDECAAPMAWHPRAPPRGDTSWSERR